MLQALQRVAGEGGLAVHRGAGPARALREAIAGFYRQAHGVDLDPSRVVVTAGASAALLLVTAALVEPGDQVIVGDPSYPCNRQFLSSFGADGGARAHQRGHAVPARPGERTGALDRAHAQA